MDAAEAMRGPLALAGLEAPVERVVRAAGGTQDETVAGDRLHGGAGAARQGAGDRCLRAAGTIPVEIEKYDRDRVVGRLDTLDPMTDALGDALFAHHAPEVRTFERPVGVGGGAGKGRHQGHVPAAVGEQLSQADSHEIAVGIQHQHALADVLASEDLLGRGELWSCDIDARDGIGAERAAAVAHPRGAGCQYHALDPVIEQVAGGYDANAKADGNIGELVQLRLAPSDHSAPFGEAGQAYDVAQVPTQMRGRL